MIYKLTPLTVICAVMCFVSVVRLAPHIHQTKEDKNSNKRHSFVTRDMDPEEWNTDKIIDSHNKSDFVEPRERRHNPVENHHKLTQLYFNKNTENLSRLSNNYILAYPQQSVEGGVRQGTFQNSLEKDVNVLPKSNIFDNNWSIKNNVGDYMESRNKGEADTGNKENAEKKLSNSAIMDNEHIAFDMDNDNKIQNTRMTTNANMNTQIADITQHHSKQSIPKLPNTNAANNVFNKESLEYSGLHEKHGSNDKIENFKGVNDGTGDRFHISEDDVESELQTTTGITLMSETDVNDFTERLLEYLFNENDNDPHQESYDYARYPSAYYLHRQRRAYDIRKRHNDQSKWHPSGHSKRTKRDLVDDLHYSQPYTYNPIHDLVEADENFSNTKTSELQNVLTNLLSLYMAAKEEEIQKKTVNKESNPINYYSKYIEHGHNSLDTGWLGKQAYVKDSTSDNEWNYLKRPILNQAWQPNFYEGESNDLRYNPATIKREMLSMVPNWRRKRYFFPFAREPYTHWGAFLPEQEKKSYDYVNAIKRLKTLAMDLVDSNHSKPSWRSTER